MKGKIFNKRGYNLSRRKMFYEKYPKKLNKWNSESFIVSTST